MTTPAEIHRPALPELTAEAREHIAELTRSLEQALGEQLVCLLVFGSAVRGGYVEGHSDINVMVVLKDASGPWLDALARPLNAARLAARVEAMIFTAAEIPRAADVFPLLYEDIRRGHALLSGLDPFSGIEIDPAHLRLEVERELREQQLRLRRRAVDGDEHEGPFAVALLRQIKQVAGPLRALLGLRGVACDDALSAVLAEAGRLLGVDVAPLARVPEAPGPAGLALAHLVAAAVDEACRIDL